MVVHAAVTKTGGLHRCGQFYKLTRREKDFVDFEYRTPADQCVRRMQIKAQGRKKC